MQPPDFLPRADGLKLAYRLTRGRGPTILFLPGYFSDMQGGKAEAIAAWALREGRSCLRLDYSGCGESEGAFEAGTLELWRADVMTLVDAFVPGPLLLVGSSMGGWLALLIALARPDQVVGLIGIAAAPDFTEWGFSADDKQSLIREGRLAQFSEYGPEPTITTRGFWESGQRNRLLDAPIAINCPVRLLHGQCDQDVPWAIATRLASCLCSADVQTILVKDGDHRLSREADIDLLIATVAQLLDRL